MMSWRIDPRADTPPSRQLVELVLDAVSRGALAPGGKLPSVRKMAGEALVNANTVAKAYRDLEQMGVVQGQNGRGVFVTEAGPSLAAQRRGAATLAAFERAAEEALRSGHDLQDLVTRLTHASRRRTA